MRVNVFTRGCLAALSFVLLTTGAFAGAWFDDFDRAYNWDVAAPGETYAAQTKFWSGADGKTKGTLDTTHAITTNSLLVSQFPTEARPQRGIRGTAYNNAILDTDPTQGRLSVWFYDDGADIKGFNIVVFDTVTSIALGLSDAQVGVDTNYTYTIGGTPADTGIVRTTGWHYIQVAIATTGTELRIDGQDWAGNTDATFTQLNNQGKLQIRTDFGAPTDENKVWIDSIRWQPGNAFAVLPAPVFVAFVDNFDDPDTGAHPKTRPPAWAGSAANMYLPHIDDDGVNPAKQVNGFADEPERKGCMDANADQTGPREAVGFFPGIVPFTGRYRLGFSYMNGPSWGGPNDRRWPNLTVGITGGGVANLGSDQVTGFTPAYTSSSDLVEGADLTVTITGDATPDPITQFEREKFIRVDQMFLELELPPASVPDWNKM